MRAFSPVDAFLIPADANVEIYKSIITFILELIMIGSLAFYGYHKGGTAMTKYILAFALPLFSILLWSNFAAPKAARRLPMPYLAFFRGILFLIAAYLLYKSNKPNLALTVAVFSIATQITSMIVED